MLQQLKDGIKEGLRDWLNSDDDGDKELNDIALEYSLKDLAKATNNFAADRKLGSGAAGAVYRGVLRGGTEVAVKVMCANGDLMGFEDEVRVLSRFRHPNLVTLLGWGQHQNDKYLVYELLMGGDASGRLEKCRDGRAGFTWQERLRVCLDAACGLSHMMNSQPKAFHRDIKPANILLDANGNGKMADFGLAGTIQTASGRQHLTVEEISGTPGYACPTYISTGHVTEQSEVYSFGIVLLELLLNQPPALAGPQGDIIYPLLQTVQPAAPGAHERVAKNVDRRAGSWPQLVLDRYIELALACVDMAADRRPVFETIVRALRQLHRGDVGGVGVPLLPPGIGQWVGTTATRQPSKTHSSEDQRSSPPPASLPANRAQAGYMSGTAQGGYVPGGTAPPPPAQRAAPAPPAEIVLECVRADGVDVAGLEPALRALAFGVVVNGQSSWQVSVGRQHQPDFFERCVATRDSLSCISRSHFELVLEAPFTTLHLRKLSGNPLLIDDKICNSADPVPLPDGARVGFCGTADQNVKFLSLRVRLRSSHSVVSEGAHPAIAAMAACQRHRQEQKAVAPPSTAAPPARSRTSSGSTARPLAVLECVKSVGCDISALAPESRLIAVPNDEILEVGRQHQLGFFEQLLREEPKWLHFISRTHFQVQLAREKGPNSKEDRCCIKVENLSSNVVLVCRRPLAKGQGGLVTPEGGTLGFVAMADKASDQEPTVFLEFKFKHLPRGAAGGG